MSQLSANHSRHILQGFLNIHKQMSELESLLVQSASASPFTQYVKDVSPTECLVIQDHFARIRSAMVAHLEDLSIPLEVRTMSVRWTLETCLMHLQVAVDDMGPKQLAGYGQLDPTGQAAVARIQDDLTRLLECVRASLDLRGCRLDTALGIDSIPGWLWQHRPCHGSARAAITPRVPVRCSGQPASALPEAPWHQKRLR